jgi:chemotaxis protein CheX
MTEPQESLTHDEIAALICADTQRVFSTMLGVDVKPGPATVHANGVENDGGVVSLIGFTGNWAGSGSVRCSEHLACAISGKMLMTEYDKVNEEVLDAMGEIANMIIGNFKDDAAYKLGPLCLSTPTVIYGNSFQTRNVNGQSWISVPFDYEGETFEVKICLVENRVAYDLLRAHLVVPAES